MRDVRERAEPDFGPAPGYPTTVTIAGIAWIIFGGLILLNLLVLLLLMFVLAAGGQAGVALAGGVCGGLVLGMFGAAFMFVGVQSVRGTARDTLGNGIGSVIFGLLYSGFGVLQVGNGEMIQAGIGLFAGVGLLIAGALALVGRHDYKRWRDAQRVKRAETVGVPSPPKTVATQRNIGIAPPIPIAQPAFAPARDEVQCYHCAEPILRQAKKCKHCGETQPPRCLKCGGELEFSPDRKRAKCQSCEAVFSVKE